MRHYWVDRIVTLLPGQRAVGLKAVALSEDVFNEHFPGNPIFPGVYLLEGLAQTAGVLLARTYEQQIALMATIDRARFPSFARPGDAVELAVEIEAVHESTIRVIGVATVNGREVATARLTFRMLNEQELIPPIYRAFWRDMLRVWSGDHAEAGDS